jgi:uncharacterized membrane protein
VWRSLTAQLMLVALGILVAATVIGVIHLWPQGELKSQGGQFTQPQTVPARVTGVAETTCGTPGASSCRRVTVRIEGGADKGQTFSFVAGQTASEVELQVGDRVRMYRNNLPPNARAGGARVDAYSFADFDRGRSMLWLAIAFAVLVLVTGRLRGLRALVGLALSLVIVVEFIIPSILHGGSPVGVALVGSFAVMLTTIPLAHGLGPKAIAASLGTAAALLLTAGLATLFTDLTHLTGVSSDESIFLRATTGQISLQGILLAGMVIGALGVLDDLTVSQASTVMALRRANPGLGFTELVRGALDVGHDHIAATVNTLVLAYVGSSLPVLLIFSIGGASFTDAVNNEAVAEQIVGTLVGSIGLIAAVPVTTVLAAWLASRVPARSLRDAHPAHAH